MSNPEASGAPSRGRPRKDVQRHVIQDLMEAAESVLANKTVKEITIHELAVAAGVNVAMIHYYFGGKDGLMVAIFDELMREAPYRRAKNITEDCIDNKSIRPLIDELVSYYYSRSSLIRMTIVENIRTSSRVKSAYETRYFDVTPDFVESLVQSMVDLGIYSNSFDVKSITTFVFSMIMGPIVFLSSTNVLRTPDKMDGQEWIDDISRLIDVALKAPVSN